MVQKQNHQYDIALDSLFLATQHAFFKEVLESADDAGSRLAFSSGVDPPAVRGILRAVRKLGRLTQR